MTSGTLPQDDAWGQRAAAAASLPDFQVVALPEDPRLGEPFSVGLAVWNPAISVRDLRVSLLNARGQLLTRAVFFVLPPDPTDAVSAAWSSPVAVYAALLSVPSTALSGAATLRVENDWGAVTEIPLTIGARNFVAEEIPLDQGNTDILTVEDPQKTRESEQLWAILSRTGTEFYADRPFQTPIPADTRRTSFFGDRRIYRYVDGASSTSVHAGIDYGVPTGTGVAACASGTVVFARPRIVTGNSVIIEHLPGVYSLYYHLSELLVAEGDLVEAGTPIGKSGSTGLSTGPHLHWEIRVATENTDPDACVERPLLDRDALLAKLLAF
jgi:murein DD-endopeptidase MepM/ murein hydrolase activator NlpD